MGKAQRAHHARTDLHTDGHVAALLCPSYADCLSPFAFLRVLRASVVNHETEPSSPRGRTACDTFSMKVSMVSTGTGKMMVELFSPAMPERVCR